MKRLLWLVGIALLSYLIWIGVSMHSSPQNLMIFCAASLGIPMEEIVSEFRNETGIQVRTQLGASRQLLAGIVASKKGDVFIPADDSYIDMRTDIFPTKTALATMRVTAVARRGNPLNVMTSEDFTRKEVRVGLPDPETAASGKLAKQAFGDKWGMISANVRVTKPTVTEIANDLKLGSIDAGIIFDSMLGQYPELVPISFLEFRGSRANVSAAVPISSKKSVEAQRFVQFLTDEKASKIFRKHGFTAVTK